MEYKNSIIESAKGGEKPQIFAKLESANPGGSVKDLLEILSQSIK